MTRLFRVAVAGVALICGACTGQPPAVQVVPLPGPYPPGQANPGNIAPGISVRIGGGDVWGGDWALIPYRAAPPIPR